MEKHGFVIGGFYWMEDWASRRLPIMVHEVGDNGVMSYYITKGPGGPIWDGPFGESGYDDFIPIHPLVLLAAQAD